MNTQHVHAIPSSRRVCLLITLVAAVIAFTLATTPPIFALPPKGTLTSSLNPSTYGQAVTFTYAESLATARPLGSGMQFFDGQTLMGYGHCTANGNLVCTFITSSLSIGTHTISAYQPGWVSLIQQVNGPAEVPEADTLLLLGGGIGGLATWLRFKWNRRRKTS